MEIAELLAQDSAELLKSVIAIGVAAAIVLLIFSDSALIKLLVSAIALIAVIAAVWIADALLGTFLVFIGLPLIILMIKSGEG